jgi:FkbM family methyltransferase
VRVLRFQGHSFVADLLGSDSVVVDLGANVGAFAGDVIERFGCRVWAVEAVPELAERLRGRAGIVVEHAAMGGREGHADLETFAGRYASAVLDAPTPSLGRVRVPATTLEALLARHGLERVDLLKVDIEGSELEMFAATSDRTLTSCIQMTVEFHGFMDPSLAPRVRETDARLRALGFQRIAFTWDDSDTLYVNSSARRITWPGRVWVIARFKYWTAAVRRISRGLRRLGLGEPA